MEINHPATWGYHMQKHPMIPAAHPSRCWSETCHSRGLSATVFGFSGAARSVASAPEGRPNGGVPARHGGSPRSLDGFFQESPNLKWMMTGGSPMTSETSKYYTVCYQVPFSFKSAILGTIKIILLVMWVKQCHVYHP